MAKWRTYRERVIASLLATLAQAVVTGDAFGLCVSVVAAIVDGRLRRRGSGPGERA